MQPAGASLHVSFFGVAQRRDFSHVGSRLGVLRRVIILGVPHSSLVTELWGCSADTTVLFKWK